MTNCKTKNKKQIGQPLIYIEETDSTNLEAVRNAESLPHGAVIVADCQTKGVGRRGRKWRSPAGQNLYFSVSLKPNFSPNKASMLTLVMAVAVARSIAKVCEAQGSRVQIKWPNDIVVNGKKVCGILTQMELSGTDIKQVIIGVGINVNQEVFEGDDLAYASSLKRETAKSYDRGTVLQDVLCEFALLYETFEKELNLSFLKEEYEDLLVNRLKEVRVLDAKGEYEAVAIGINEIGELTVQKKDGAIETVYAGEVSVRGLYGYV